MDFYTIDERIIPETNLYREYGRLICEGHIVPNFISYQDFLDEVTKPIAQKTYNWGIEKYDKPVGEYKFKFAVKEIGFVNVKSVPEIAQELAENSIVSSLSCSDIEEKNFEVVCHCCENKATFEQLKLLNGVYVCKKCYAQIIGKQGGKTKGKKVNQHNGKYTVQSLAKQLHVSRNTIYKKLRTIGIDINYYRDRFGLLTSNGVDIIYNALGIDDV